MENQNHDSGEVPVAQNGIDFGTVADPSLSTEREVSDEDLGFSSEDIAKREKTEYFTNVKGAEKIKRQEERKREAEEKLISLKIKLTLLPIFVTASSVFVNESPVTESASRAQSFALAFGVLSK